MAQYYSLYSWLLSTIVSSSPSPPPSCSCSSSSSFLSSSPSPPPSCSCFCSSSSSSSSSSFSPSSLSSFFSSFFFFFFSFFPSFYKCAKSAKETSSVGLHTTMGQNNQKSRCKYWATRSSVRSFACSTLRLHAPLCSLICSLAHFAHSRALRKVNKEMAIFLSFFYFLDHSAYNATSSLLTTISFHYLSVNLSDFWRKN